WTFEAPQLKGNRYPAPRTSMQYQMHLVCPVNCSHQLSGTAASSSRRSPRLGVPLLNRADPAAPYNKPFKLTARFRAVDVWTFEAPQLKGNRYPALRTSMQRRKPLWCVP